MPILLSNHYKERGDVGEASSGLWQLFQQTGRCGGENREQIPTFLLLDHCLFFCSSGNIFNQKDNENRYYDRKDFGDGVHVGHNTEFVSAVCHLERLREFS
jgi:hypothetical protein